VDGEQLERRIGGALKAAARGGKRSTRVYFCPACPTTRQTQVDIVEHARMRHGLTRSEATGGWSRPEGWNPTDAANATRRFR